MTAGAANPSRFQRFLLPGFALKAVIIGGGYATGRELAEYFVPSGPWGGLAAMLLATVIWSIVAALTFALARKFGAYDYRAFFRELRQPNAMRIVCQDAGVVLSWADCSAIDERYMLATPTQWFTADLAP